MIDGVGLMRYYVVWHGDKFGVDTSSCNAVRGEQAYPTAAHARDEADNLNRLYSKDTVRICPTCGHAMLDKKYDGSCYECHDEITPYCGMMQRQYL